MSDHMLDTGFLTDYDTMDNDAYFLDTIHVPDVSHGSQPPPNYHNQHWVRVATPPLEDFVNAEWEWASSLLPEQQFDFGSGTISSNSSALLSSQGNNFSGLEKAWLDNPVEQAHTMTRAQLPPANDHVLQFDNSPPHSNPDSREGDVRPPCSISWMCPQGCESVTFKRQAELNRHLNEQHRCRHRDCRDLLFSTSIERDNHEKSHSETELGIWCGSCLLKGKGKQFKRFEKVKKHFNSVHKESNKSNNGFQCQESSCGFGSRGGVFFASDADLHEHIKLEHSHIPGESRPDEGNSHQFLQGFSSGDSMLGMDTEPDVGPLIHPQEIDEDQTDSYHPQKHFLGGSTKPGPKRRKCETVCEYFVPIFGDHELSFAEALSSNTASLKTSSTALSMARSRVPLANCNPPRNWDSETTLFDSIDIADLCGLLGHTDLPSIVGALKRLRVSAIFIRPKRAINLRGVLSQGTVESARALIEPLLPVLKPKAEGTTPKSHRVINRRFHPKQQQEINADCTEVLAIHPTEDEEAVLTWKHYIVPKLSEVLEGVELAYTVTLVRQKISEHDPAPVIRFQPGPRKPYTQELIRNRIQTICSLNSRPQLPTHFYKGAIVRLVGSTTSFTDDPSDVEILHRTRYYGKPGMSASIGMSHCDHSYATLGGYILVAKDPYMLTVQHFIDDAERCCQVTGTADKIVSSPALLDVRHLGNELDEEIQDFHLQIEHSEPMQPGGEADLAALIDLRPHDDFKLMTCYTRWREELGMKSEEYNLGKLITSSAQNDRAEPCKNRDITVKHHRMDWAIFEVHAPRLGKNRFRHPTRVEPNLQDFEIEVYTPEGTGQVCAASREFKVRERVYYVGRSSGYREGIINPMPVICTEGDSQTQEWSIIPLGQAEINKEDVEGDSGAWVIAKEDDNVVGLLWGFNGRLIFFTPINDVFEQIGKKMREGFVEVAPPWDRSPTAEPLLVAHVSGNGKRSPCKKIPKGKQARKRLLSLSQSQSRAEKKQYDLARGTIDSSRQIIAATRLPECGQLFSRSPSPIPSLTSSDSSFSGSPSPSPPFLGLPSPIYDLAAPFGKLNIQMEPNVLTTPSPPGQDSFTQLTGHRIEVEV